MSLADDLDLPDSAEGRAVAQIAAELAADRGRLATTRKLARIAATAMASLVGEDAASLFFVRLSQDLLRRRGCGRGAKRA